MADEFVYVRLGSDKTAVPGRVTKEAFDTIWKAKGWTIVDNDEAELAISPETQAEIAAGETNNKKKG